MELQMPSDKIKYIDAATRLKSLRVAKGISVPKLAEKLGVSAPRYRTWERIFGPLPQRQYGDAINQVLSDLDTETRWPVAEDSPPSSDTLNFDELGNRAAKRRKSLNFSRTFVAAKMGVSTPTLKSWETSLPKHHRGEREDAWEDVLDVPRGWLRHSSFCPVPLEDAVLHFPELSSVADEIRAIGSWLSRQHAATRTWNFDVLSEQERRRAIMFADRYGVSGEDKTTLQIIGDRFGLTRERVRQIIDVMTNRARGAQFNLPKLAQLKAAVSTAELCAVTEFQATYRDLLGGVSLADADRFAREILGFSVASISGRTFGLTSSTLQPMIIESGAQEIMIAVRAASLRMIRSCGAAHLLFVTGLVSEAIGKAVALGNVRSVLAAIDGMEWLTPDEDWFWLGPDTANNRVLEAVRKVLAAACRKVDVEDLHQAVCRSRRAYYKSDIRAQPPEIEVPQEVLREILLRVPWLSVVQMNDFILTEDVAVEDVLNSSELAIVRVIEEHGGAATRQVFNKMFVDTGAFSLPNLQIVLTTSPVIRQLGYGIYGVRGTEFPQKAYSVAHASVTKFTSRVDKKEDGWCEFMFSISPAGLRNNNADIPMGVLKVIPRGIYTAEGVVTGTISLGTISSAPSRTGGLVVLLRKANIQPGEPLLFRIHPESMRAVITRVEPMEAS